MGLRKIVTAGLARQLGHPSGAAGRWIGWMLNRRNARTVLAAVDALGLRPGERVGDIGFGGGLSLPRLLDAVGPEGTVHAVDISRTMLRRAADVHAEAVAAGRLVVAFGSLGELPLPDDALDAIMSVNTIYFVPDLPGVFRELARVLAPGGRLVVGVGDPDGMRRNPVTDHGFRVRDLAEVVEALDAAGLTLTDHRQVGDGDDADHLLVARPSTQAEGTSAA